MTFQRRSKFNATRVEHDGLKFASKKEARRHADLKRLERAGAIHNLETQVRIALHTMGGEVVGHYVADFRYLLPGRGVVVEDAKGFKTDLYRWKARHFKAEYGVEIVET